MPIRSPSGHGTEELTRARPAPAGNKPPPVPPTLAATEFDGEETSWGCLLEHLAPLLLAAAPRLRHLGIPFEDALEAVHQAIFEALSLDAPPAQEYAWHFLWTRAVWRAHDIAERNRRAATLLPPEVLATRARKATDSADVEAAQQLNTAVWDAVAELPDSLHNVVRCRYYAGLTLRETAELLGIDIGTVKRRQRRAKRLLRVALADIAELFLGPGKSP